MQMEMIMQNLMLSHTTVSKGNNETRGYGVICLQYNIVSHFPSQFQFQFQKV